MSIPYDNSAPSSDGYFQQDNSPSHNAQIISNPVQAEFTGLQWPPFLTVLRLSWPRNVGKNPNKAFPSRIKVKYKKKKNNILNLYKAYVITDHWINVLMLIDVLHPYTPTCRVWKGIREKSEPKHKEDMFIHNVAWKMSPHGCCWSESTRCVN